MVDKENESSIVSDNLLRIATQLVINYCPWCGRKLSKQVKHYGGLDRNDLRIGFEKLGT